MCYVKHNICIAISQKISQRWVPSALAALQAGMPVERLAFAAACWLRYCRGVDEQGCATNDRHKTNQPGWVMSNTWRR